MIKNYKIYLNTFFIIFIILFLLNSKLLSNFVWTASSLFIDFKIPLEWLRCHSLGINLLTLEALNCGDRTVSQFNYGYIFLSLPYNEFLDTIYRNYFPWILIILIILPNLLSFQEPMCLSIDWISGWLSILWDEFSVILLNNGFLLFSSIVILPAFVLPVSPLLAFAGIWGETNGTLEAAIFSSIALSLNCVWTYWLARLCGLKVVNKFYFFC